MWRINATNQRPNDACLSQPPPPPPATRCHCCCCCCCHCCLFVLLPMRSYKRPKWLISISSRRCNSTRSIIVRWRQVRSTQIICNTPPITPSHHIMYTYTTPGAEEWHPDWRLELKRGWGMRLLCIAALDAKRWLAPTNDHSHDTRRKVFPPIYMSIPVPGIIDCNKTKKVIRRSWYLTGLP